MLQLAQQPNTTPNTTNSFEQGVCSVGFKLKIFTIFKIFKSCCCCYASYYYYYQSFCFLLFLLSTSLDTMVSNLCVQFWLRYMQYMHVSCTVYFCTLDVFFTSMLWLCTLAFFILSALQQRCNISCHSSRAWGDTFGFYVTRSPCIYTCLYYFLLCPLTDRYCWCFALSVCVLFLLSAYLTLLLGRCGLSSMYSSYLYTILYTIYFLLDLYTVHVLLFF